MDKKNKIDSVIDEVIESKRLKQGFRAIILISIMLAIIFSILLGVSVFINH